MNLHKTDFLIAAVLAFGYHLGNEYPSVGWDGVADLVVIVAFVWVVVVPFIRRHVQGRKA